MKLSGLSTLTTVPTFESDLSRKVQGLPGDGKTCGFFNVMPGLGCIVEHLIKRTPVTNYNNASAATTECQ